MRNRANGPNTPPETTSQRQLRRRFNFIARFFAKCAGANLAILSRYADIRFPLLSDPITTIAASGTLVFFTAVFATLSGFYALYTIFQSVPVAAAFGLIWGFFIFSLDRFFVSSIRKQGTGLRNFLRDLLQITPRLAFAVVIALVIARPLELRLFNDEIIEELNKEEANKVRESRLTSKGLQDSLQRRYDLGIQLASLETERLKIDYDIRHLDDSLLTLYKAVLCETYGTECPPGIVSSNKLGYGDLAKIKRKEYESFNSELPEIKKQLNNNLHGIDSTIAKMKRQGISSDTAYLTQILERKKEVAVQEGLDTTRIQQDFHHSFLKRNRALSRLESDEDAKWTIWMVNLLFLGVEIAPILGKLLLPFNDYDRAILEATEEALKDQDRRRRASIEESKVNRLLLQTLSRAQQELVKERIEAWKKEQQKQHRQSQPGGDPQ